jgi:hypothetical protein
VTSQPDFAHSAVPELANEAKTIGDYRMFDELKRHFKSPLLPIASRVYVPHRKTMNKLARQRNKEFLKRTDTDSIVIMLTSTTDMNGCPRFIR